MINDEDLLSDIIEPYRKSFENKTFAEHGNETDFLMNVLGITPEQKYEHSQYFSRELGMAWQKIVTHLASKYCRSNFQEAYKIGNEEPFDLIIGKDAIDTKYRIGSGDSGTLRKFRQNGELLSGMGFRPVMLIVRNDNLPAAITAVRNGGWAVYTAQDSLDYIQEKTGINLLEVLESINY